MLYRFAFPYSHSNRPTRVVALLRDYVRGNALDVGCGDGRNLLYMDKFSDKVIGIDLARNRMLDLSRLGKCVVEYDLREISIPFKDNSFDVILCAHVLEHIPNPGLVISELASVCRQSGHIIVGVPNPFCVYYDFYDERRHPGHITKMSWRQWERVLDDAGLVVTKRYTNFPLFWNTTWGKIVNSLPIKNYLSDMWFVCRKKRQKLR